MWFYQNYLIFFTPSQNTIPVPDLGWLYLINKFCYWFFVLNVQKKFGYIKLEKVFVLADSIPATVNLALKNGILEVKSSNQSESY